MSYNKNRDITIDPWKCNTHSPGLPDPLTYPPSQLQRPNPTPFKFLNSLLLSKVYFQIEKIEPRR